MNRVEQMKIINRDYGKYLERNIDEIEFDKENNKFKINYSLKTEHDTKNFSFDLSYKNNIKEKVNIEATMVVKIHKLLDNSTSIKNLKTKIEELYNTTTNENYSSHLEDIVDKPIVGSLTDLFCKNKPTEGCIISFDESFRSSNPHIIQIFAGAIKQIYGAGHRYVLLNVLNILVELVKILDKLEEEKNEKDSLIAHIKKIIETLNNDENLKNIMQQTNSSLKLENTNIQQNFGENECYSIEEIIEKSKTVPKQTPDNSDQSIINQMSRIKDGRISATKMILMHLVTGEGYKHFMVKETIELTKKLFDSTDLKLNDKELEETAYENIEEEVVEPLQELLQDPRHEELLQTPIHEEGGSLPPRLPLLRGHNLEGGGNELYKEKYLKYREKYLKLKYNIN